MRACFLGNKFMIMVLRGRCALVPFVCEIAAGNARQGGLRRTAHRPENLVLGVTVTPVENRFDSVFSSKCSIIDHTMHGGLPPPLQKSCRHVRGSVTDLPKFHTNNKKQEKEYGVGITHRQR